MHGQQNIKILKVIITAIIRLVPGNDCLMSPTRGVRYSVGGVLGGALGPTLVGQEGKKNTLYIGFNHAM